MFKYKKLYLAQKAENERLSVENGTLRKNVTDMNGAVQRSADEIANLNMQLTAKQIELDTAREQAAGLRKELSDTKAELIDVRKKLGDAGAELASVSETSEHWIKQADEFEEKFKAETALNSTITAKLKRANKEIGELKATLADKEKEIHELNGQVVVLLEDNETLEHDLAAHAEGDSSLRGKCEGCENEGNYRKCSSCLRGHAKDKYTPVQPEISSSADDGNSENDGTIIEEGAIVGEPVEIDDIPVNADVAELKTAEITLDVPSEEDIPAGADVAELREEEIPVDIPCTKKISEVSLVAEAPTNAQRITPASEDKAPAKKKPSRKKKKAAKKK